MITLVVSHISSSSGTIGTGSIPETEPQEAALAPIETQPAGLSRDH